jgi:hypothetical protein
MLHVLIMLFSSHSKEKKKHREHCFTKKRRQAAAGIRMWDRKRGVCVEDGRKEEKKYIKHSRENSAAQKNVIYFLGNENENVSQRE